LRARERHAVADSAPSRVLDEARAMLVGADDDEMCGRR